MTFESGKAQVTLVELYSSQGCSSCPPAQRWVNQFKDDPQLWKKIIPVVFHVDYWNYLGWKDPYSHPSYSTRQRQLKWNGQLRSVYTPGFVVNGQEWRGWFRCKALPISNAEVGNLVLTANGANAHLSFTPTEHYQQEVAFHIAGLTLETATHVFSGENKNKTLKESFTVLDKMSVTPTKLNDVWSHVFDLGELHPREDARIEALVAWASIRDGLTPIQATGGRWHR